MSGRRGFDEAYAGSFVLPPLIPDACARFGQALYGPVPPPPDALEVERQPLRGESAERLVLTFRQGGRSFTADAALWLPAVGRPKRLVAGLDFVGPAGILPGTAFPLDKSARVYSRPELGARQNRLDPVLRGTAAPSWPVEYLTAQGCAVLVACYGSFVPDDSANWGRYGLSPFLGTEAGAISLWAWGMSRLIDVAQTLGLGADDISVAGHSRLGKAALWAAVNDSRIGTVFANNSGCGGSAPAAHPVGETLGQLIERFPHWLRAGAVEDRDLDQHQLIASISPRKVYIASAEDDLWADPVGSYMALASAAGAWDLASDWPPAREIWESCRVIRRGALGYHLRPGGHGLLPYDWHLFMEFLTSRE